MISVVFIKPQHYSSIIDMKLITLLIQVKGEGPLTSNLQSLLTLILIHAYH